MASATPAPPPSRRRHVPISRGRATRLAAVLQAWTCRGVGPIMKPVEGACSLLLTDQLSVPPHSCFPPCEDAALAHLLSIFYCVRMQRLPLLSIFHQPRTQQADPHQTPYLDLRTCSLPHWEVQTCFVNYPVCDIFCYSSKKRLRLSQDSPKPRLKATQFTVL